MGLETEERQRLEAGAQVIAKGWEKSNTGFYY